MGLYRCPLVSCFLFLCGFGQSLLNMMSVLMVMLVMKAKNVNRTDGD